MDVILDSPDTSIMSASVLSRGFKSEQSSRVMEEEKPKIVSCFVRPHEGVMSSKPYTIKPAQMVCSSFVSFFLFVCLGNYNVLIK